MNYVCSQSLDVQIHDLTGIDLPVKDIEVQDLVPNGQHHLGRVDTQLHAFPPVVLRDPTIRLAARPGEVYHKDGLVVLAKDRQMKVARSMVVQDQVYVLLMNPLQGSREVASPALQEFVRCLQFVLSLGRGLPESPLIVEHPGHRADDNGVQTQDRKPVRLLAGLWRGVVNPVVIQYLSVLWLEEISFFKRHREKSSYW